MLMTGMDRPNADFRWARTALGGQIGVLLDDRPDLLADVLAVLKRETGDHIAQTMTLEDNNRSVVQNSGCNVSG